MFAKKITRNDIKNAGLPVYGFGYDEAPLEVINADNYIGNNCGKNGHNYDVYLNIFDDNTKYIVVTGYHVPKKWLENGCKLLSHQILKGVLATEKKYAGIL